MRVHRATAALMICAGAALATATVPATATAATTPPTPTRHVAVIDCIGHAQERPGNFMLACGDGNNVLKSLHWSQWRDRSAVAKGTDFVNDCKPYCAAGHFHGYPVKVRFDTPQPRAGHSGQHYTRVTLTYTGARPAGTPRVVTTTLWG
ncbi:hypothetical protein ACIQU6_32615 [Streptomyces sp. NPDC090442]|uniref:hypothetical protein n=1 Tax=Streptomyces sp. NPDC090442 TaxID=3365962 RepID=UPI0037F2ECD1